ncbi:hypothetical protein P692DRAFT_201709428, partial [Suillus brevipes Sb2]
CPEWKALAINGLTIYLFTRPGYCPETFFDRKPNYSVGCQAVTLPHNLLIVDYSLSHPGSIHDPFTFHSTCLYDKHADLLPDGHWVWADSAYFHWNHGVLLLSRSLAMDD